MAGTADDENAGAATAFGGDPESWTFMNMNSGYWDATGSESDLRKGWNYSIRLLPSVPDNNPTAESVRNVERFFRCSLFLLGITPGSKDPHPLILDSPRIARGAKPYIHRLFPNGIWQNSGCLPGTPRTSQTGRIDIGVQRALDQ